MDKEGVRTVGCRLDRLVPDPNDLHDIRIIVDRVHRATIYATELLNLHLRRALRDGLPLNLFFDANWLVKAFYEVTVADTSKAQLDAELTRTRTMYMPSHTAPPRHGLKQLFQANTATELELQALSSCVECSIDS